MRGVPTEFVAAHRSSGHGAGVVRTKPIPMRCARAIRPRSEPHCLCLSTSGTILAPRRGRLKTHCRAANGGVKCRRAGHSRGHCNCIEPPCAKEEAMTSDVEKRLRAEIDEIVRSAMPGQPQLKERLDKAADHDREQALRILLKPPIFDQWRVRTLMLAEISPA
jgi:hypothetical protein